MSFSAQFLAWAREEADRPHATADLKEGEQAIARAAVRRAESTITSDMADRTLCDLAEKRAELIEQEIFYTSEPMGPHQAADWLNRKIEALQGRSFRWPGQLDGCPPPEGFLAGMYARAQCRLWWRRQLRREVVKLREREAMHRGEVCKRARQVYCTDDTVLRKARRNAANAALLEATKIEDADGEIITLAQAVATSTSNKALRRHELMTRIRGSEEWAQAAGLAAMFTTNTAPSRFHPQTMHKGANPKHHDETPADGQRWLCGTWARTRAKLQRLGLAVFGFRVAEPHHDGCPHWHMLLWCKPEELQRIRDVMRSTWLGEPRWLHFAHAAKPAQAAPIFADLLAGELGADRFEQGAAEHRFKCVEIDPAKGSAVGYVSKYISKNVDGVGAMEAEAHTDEQAGEQAELFGATAARVEAWAAAHHIRQFQAIGQPPVTVWRELRRIEPQAVQGATPRIIKAHTAAHRAPGRRANWAEYLDAQGGAMVGRSYRVRIVADREQIEGRYGVAEALRVRGVCDVDRADVLVMSARRKWKAAGTWAAHEREANPLRAIRLTDPAEKLRELLGFGEAPKATCPPRTRFNNCTHRTGGVEELMQSALIRAHAGTAIDFKTGPGGYLETEKWTKPTPPTPPTPAEHPLTSPPIWLRRLRMHRSSLLDCA